MVAGGIAMSLGLGNSCLQQSDVHGSSLSVFSSNIMSQTRIVRSNVVAKIISLRCFVIAVNPECIPRMELASCC